MSSKMEAKARIGACGASGPETPFGVDVGAVVCHPEPPSWSAGEGGWGVGC